MNRVTTQAFFMMALLLFGALAMAQDGPESPGPESPAPKIDLPESPGPSTTRTTPANRPGSLSIDIARPGDREFVRDLAGLISEADVKAIKAQCDKLLTETATPIIVVTIESMAKHGPGDLRIETFARLLFDQWEIGQATVNGQSWNTGILLLVSRDDRKARIELGGGWGREKDGVAMQIMSERIIPHFKSGDYSTGITEGVKALDAMARSKPLPKAEKPPMTSGQIMLTIGFIALAIFTVVSLVRRGSGGWAWIMWAAVFAIAGTILYQMMTNRGGSGGGGFGGGSFGGGSSGGGGATGSW